MPRAETPLVLLVDDDPAVRTVLGALLEQAGFRCWPAQSGAEALELMERHPFDVVLTDVRMPGLDGIELLRRIQRRQPELPVVLLTAHGTIPLAVEAMKAGAADFFVKPFDREEIIFVLRKAIARHRKDPDLPPDRPAADRLVGSSGPMREVHRMIERAAASNATVMIRGESGTGKELVARAIHDQSRRRNGPFVKLHCAALPDALLESELFGYERGAFTGAASRKPGRIELAHGGTLFLDEIGDITPATQVKLLRVLQERQFERLGGHETLTLDVRFLSATHRDLDRMMQTGAFREDLYYRLNVLPLWLPPLRERPDDIRELATFFLRLHGRDNDRPDARLAPAALAALTHEAWPGNVRQLENFIERLIVLSDSPLIGEEEVRRELVRLSGGRSTAPPAPAAPTGSTPPAQDLALATRLRQSEREALASALAHAGNNRTLAARLLGVSRRTLYTKLEEHGMTERSP